MRRAEGIKEMTLADEHGDSQDQTVAERARCPLALGKLPTHFTQQPHFTDKEFGLDIIC